jgi:glutathione S-transferase
MCGLSQVDEALADGRPFICGETFTAADLTFASLAAPVVLPKE